MNIHTKEELYQKIECALRSMIDCKKRFNGFTLPTSTHCILDNIVSESKEGLQCLQELQDLDKQK